MWTLSTFTCLTHSPPRPPTMNSKIFTNPFFHCDGGREIWAHFSACPHSFVVTGSIFGGAGGCSRDQITMHFFGSHMLEHFFPPARRSSKSTELLHSCKSKTAKVGVSTHTPPAQLQVFLGFFLIRDNWRIIKSISIKNQKKLATVQEECGSKHPLLPFLTCNCAGALSI